jgi:hypothetical protein
LSTGASKRCFLAQRGRFTSRQEPPGGPGEQRKADHEDEQMSKRDWIQPRSSAFAAANPR